MRLDYESLRLPETSIFKWSGYSTLSSIDKLPNSNRDATKKRVIFS